VSEDTVKTVVAVTFVLSGFLAKEIGMREATEFEIVCGLGICREAVYQVLESPEEHEQIVSQAISRLRGVVDSGEFGDFH